MITSYNEIGGGSDEFAELWDFGPEEDVPPLCGWEPLTGEIWVITFADPEIEHPATRGPEFVRVEHEWLGSSLEWLRQGLGAYHPLSFLRDDLIVTRNLVVVAAVEGRLLLLGTVCPLVEQANEILRRDLEGARTCPVVNSM